MQNAEHHREQFELAYATAWAKDRNGDETPEQLAAEIKSWRIGDTYGQDLPRLRFGWEGYQWARGSKCLAQIEEPAMPVCWIRFCSDGSTEGPIMHSQICEARKTSGAWTPLYAGAAPAAVAGPAWGEQQVHALAIQMAASAPPSHKPRDYDADMAWARSALGFIAGHAPAAPALEAPAAPTVPPGFALVPLRLTRAMDEAISEEGWQWEDLLAAAQAVTEEQYEASAQDRLSRDEVRAIFLECGFVIKEGQNDLKPYVYEAAQVLESRVRSIAAAAPQAPAQEAPAAPAVPAGFALVPIEPTQEMLNAGRWSGAGSVSIQEEWARKEMWCRMLATITPPPAAYTDDLVALVENLAQALSAAAPDNDLAGHALEYLKRNGLQGSPLWAAEAAPQAPAAAAEPVRALLAEWKDGTGLMWDVQAFGKWLCRVVSPVNWDAHGVYLALVRAGYASHIEVRQLAAPAAAQTHAGLLAAAAHIQAKAQAHLDERGGYDPDTGAVEMSESNQEHFNTLDELAEEIRLLADKAAPTSCDKPPAGWTCSRAPGHDGPCAAAPAAPAVDATSDTARLNHLQQRGATVDLLPGEGDFYPMRFRVGGLHAAVSKDIRAAIDAAIAAQAAAKGADHAS